VKECSQSAAQQGDQCTNSPANPTQPSGCEQMKEKLTGDRRAGKASQIPCDAKQANTDESAARNYMYRTHGDAPRKVESLKRIQAPDITTKPLQDRAGSEKPLKFKPLVARSSKIWTERGSLFCCFSREPHKVTLEPTFFSNDKVSPSLIHS